MTQKKNTKIYTLLILAFRAMLLCMCPSNFKNHFNITKDIADLLNKKI